MNGEKMDRIKIVEDDISLRIYIGETEKVRGVPLFEHIVLMAKDRGLSGATVFKGVMGYGADKKMHTSKILELSENLPLLIEIVDTEEKINSFIPFLDEVIKKGFITMEKIHVIKYRSR
jgi:PII-like signaling protein